MKRVKTVFEEKQKFHTLIFTINKIDMALQDKGAKSRIKSIDYIRNRIMELDNNYRDCVIFATSARDYFYTLELEDEAQRNDICRNLLGQDLFLNLRSASMELDDNEQEIKDLISRIDAEVGMLANQLGYREVYLETLKNYSGMPQLLSYISYIAKSKAREEIVNSITYMIDSEISRLQGIIDNVANIKKLINANESSIGRIREILNVYYEGSKAVLDKENLLEGDLESLDREKNLDIFSNIARYKSEFQGEHNINLNRLYSILNSALEEHDWRDIKSAILTDLDGIWKRKMDKLKAGNKKYVAKEELSISPDECNKMLQLRLKGFRDEKVTVQTFRLNKFVECLIEILNARNEKVNHLSEECRLSLEKEDCVLALPTLPSFDIGFIEPKLNTGNAKHKESNFDLSKEFRERNGIAQFFANLFNADISPENILTYKEVNFKSIPESKRKELFEIVKKDINSWLTDDVRLDDLVNEIVIQLKSAVLENEGKIKGTFTQSNEIILSNIEDFRNIVDDTEKYKTDNDALFRKQELIQQIEGASKDFISTWQQILRDDLYEVSA